MPYSEYNNQGPLADEGDDVGDVGEADDENESDDESDDAPIEFEVRSFTICLAALRPRESPCTSFAVSSSNTYIKKKKKCKSYPEHPTPAVCVALLLLFG
jgi:hypothetical protein